MIVGIVIVIEIAVFYVAELNVSVQVDHGILVRAGRYRLRPILMTSLIAMVELPLDFHRKQLQVTA
jgi:multidrug efflux pump subunit AcrB